MPFKKPSGFTITIIRKSFKTSIENNKWITYSQKDLETKYKELACEFIKEPNNNNLKYEFSSYMNIYIKCINKPQSSFNIKKN